jgi:hypothetical protein
MLPGHHHHLHTNQLQAFALESADDLTDKATLDTIGLNQDKCAFQKDFSCA